VLQEASVAVEPVVGIAMVACWVFLYMVIGGRWPKPFLSGPISRGMWWRALIATGLFVAILLAGAIFGLWTIPPQTGE
jgi:hypothetical protein